MQEITREVLIQKAEELLHTDHEGWDMPLNPRMSRR